MKRSLVALALVGAAVTGCGGSDGGAVAVRQSSSPTASAEPTKGTALGGAVLSAECLKAAEAYRSSSTAFSAGMSTDLSTTLGAVAAQLKAYKDKAPSGEVRDAFGTLAGIYGDIADKLRGVSYVPKPGSPPPAEYLAAIREFASPKFAAAARTLGTYFGTQCKG